MHVKVNTSEAAEKRQPFSLTLTPLLPWATCTMLDIMKRYFAGCLEDKSIISSFFKKATKRVEMMKCVLDMPNAQRYHVLPVKNGFMRNAQPYQRRYGHINYGIVLTANRDSFIVQYSLDYPKP